MRLYGDDNMILEDDGHIDLQGVKLKYLACDGDINITSVDCSNMVSCELSYVTPLTERVLFESMSATGEKISRLEIENCENIELLCETLQHLKRLQTLLLSDDILMIRNCTITFLYRSCE
ncbi:hypothetical protein DPMN_067474 [Dreissena polymorpha]|uniref:Uncharacterized protein n=1 Tax=Dreissena polymorpha TaxID=45954 RepID=A0A9D4BSU0_DREPO|nr:hypothetical protein DPMN_067374 [Dreissena polymorpha]KAH3708035.1 hypothetical protein DPMN_067474 [Dreissena polymorpha]